ncbi:MAG: Uma2 family endonuclease, partial [Leptolyngbyaceae cyanobacterium CAN_BIN12]|nr:Uma2 family endonuclease [Leptolyngbyaceae cyanobacterium CAN_BIN12]
FIGKPKQPTLTICQLVEDGYFKQRYLLGMAIQSTLFPELRLALEDVMP